MFYKRQQKRDIYSDMITLKWNVVEVCFCFYSFLFISFLLFLYNVLG